MVRVIPRSEAALCNTQRRTKAYDWYEDCNLIAVLLVEN